MAWTPDPSAPWRSYDAIMGGVGAAFGGIGRGAEEYARRMAAQKRDEIMNAWHQGEIGQQQEHWRGQQTLERERLAQQSGEDAARRLNDVVIANIRANASSKHGKDDASLRILRNPLIYQAEHNPLMRESPEAQALAAEAYQREIGGTPMTGAPAMRGVRSTPMMPEPQSLSLGGADAAAARLARQSEEGGATENLPGIGAPEWIPAQPTGATIGQMPSLEAPGRPRTAAALESPGKLTSPEPMVTAGVPARTDLPEQWKSVAQKALEQNAAKRKDIQKNKEAIVDKITERMKDLMTRRENLAFGTLDQRQAFDAEVKSLSAELSLLKTTAAETMQVDPQELRAIHDRMAHLETFAGRQPRRTGKAAGGRAGASPTPGAGAVAEFGRRAQRWKADHGGAAPPEAVMRQWGADLGIR